MRGGASLARAYRMVRKHFKKETGLDPDDELPTPGSPGCQGTPAPPALRSAGSACSGGTDRNKSLSFTAPG